MIDILNIGRLVGGYLVQVLMAAGGAAVLLFFIFRTVGERWVSSWFDKSLEAMRQAHELELESVRLDSNTALERTVKLNQREFETLPEAWSLAVDAMPSVQGLVAGLKSYPNLEALSPPQLEHFLDTSPLDDWEREELRATGDKTKYYQRAVGRHEFGDAVAKHGKFRLHVLKNGIFFDESLHLKLSELAGLMWYAIVEYQRNASLPPGERLHDDRVVLLNEGPQLMDDLAKAVRTRLWPKTLSSSV